MSVILLRYQAAEPYNLDMLGQRIWSSQELCFLIGRYTALFLEDLLTDGLLVWLGSQGGEPALSAALKRARSRGERNENLVLTIARYCDYFDEQEVRSLERKLIALRHLEKENLLREEGRLYLRAGRYAEAFDRFRKAAETAKAGRLHRTEGEESERLKRTEAICLREMACAKAMLFEDEEALRLFRESGRLYPDKETERLYRLMQQSVCAPADEERADRELLRAQAAAEHSALYQEAAELSERRDPVSEERIRAILKQLRQEYRQML